MTKRKRRRKSRSAALYIPVGVFLVLVLLTLGIGVFLRVVDIEVAGLSMYTPDEIVLASGISAGDNMLFLESDAAVRRIRMAMPYINEVKIEFMLPATVRIVVKESKAVAAIEHQNAALLIDSSGRVLGKAGAVREGLIEIRGFIPSEAEIGSRLRAAPDSESQLTSITDILSALEREGFLDRVSYLDVTHIGAISFSYINRFNVILGGSGDADYMLSLLPDIVEKINEGSSEDATGRIDMSDSSKQPRFTPDW